MSKFISVVTIILYPLIVFVGLNYFHLEPRYLVFALVIVFLLRFIFFKEHSSNHNKKHNVILIVFSIGVVFFTILYNTSLGLKFYPVIVSCFFLVVFLYSLYYPPSFIEKIARINKPDLSEKSIAYCKLITKIWIGFFFINALVSGYIALFSSLKVWAFYNGFFSYCLMGVLFLGEAIYRKIFIEKQ